MADLHEWLLTSPARNLSKCKLCGSPSWKQTCSKWRRLPPFRYPNQMQRLPNRWAACLGVLVEKQGTFLEGIGGLQERVTIAVSLRADLWSCFDVFTNNLWLIRWRVMRDDNRHWNDGLYSMCIPEWGVGAVYQHQWRTLLYLSCPVDRVGGAARNTSRSRSNAQKNNCHQIDNNHKKIILG